MTKQDAGVGGQPERPCFPEWQHFFKGWYEEDRNVKGTVFIYTNPQDPAEKATFTWILFLARTESYTSSGARV